MKQLIVNTLNIDSYSVIKVAFIYINADGMIFEVEKREFHSKTIVDII